jgi:VWFA-related protein
MRSRLSFLLYVCAAVAVVSAQGPPVVRDAQQPTFRGGVNYVHVDLYATRDGVGIDDLTADDIELREDGVAQHIEAFEHVVVRGAAPDAVKVEPTSVAASQAAAADPRARVFVIFLDTYHTQIEGSANMRLPLVRFLDRVLGPDDLVAVMTPEMSAADLAFGRKTTVISNIMQTQWDWGRRGRPTVQDPKEELYDFCFPALDGKNGSNPIAREMKERRREKMTLDALDDLVVHLTGLREERKAVLTVSEGWRLLREDTSLAGGQRPVGGGLPLPDPRRAPTAQPRETATGTNRIECDADRMALAMQDDRDRLRELSEHANRGNVSFYTIYPRGLVPFDSPIGPDKPPTLAEDSANLSTRQDSLRFLAENTDGLAVVNTNQIDAAIDHIVADLSSYYLLGYYSTNTKLDGKFRTISVKVNRPRVQVRARRGYRGLTAEEVISTTTGGHDADAVTQALNGMAGGVDNRAAFRIRASSWVAPTAGASVGKLWIVGELDYHTRRDLAWSSGAQAEVTVVSGDGTTVMTKTIDVSPANGTFAIQAPDSGSVSAGEYAVRVRVKPQSDQALPVTDLARVQVPEKASSIGEAVLWRRGPSTGPQYLMTADPRFMRTDRVRLELPTRAPTPPAGRLLDRSGKAMSIPVQMSERAEKGGDFRWIVADVALAPLAPGDYAIEVTDDGVRQVTAFRVVP